MGDFADGANVQRQLGYEFLRYVQNLNFCQDDLTLNKMLLFREHKYLIDNRLKIPLRIILGAIPYSGTILRQLNEKSIKLLNFLFDIHM